MHDLLLAVTIFALVGLAAGFGSGLFGVGGGIFRIPVFVHLFPLFGVAHGVLMHASFGTSMTLIIPTAIAASWKQRALGNLDTAYYRTWAASVFVGVLFGVMLLPYASTEVLEIIFIVFLLSVCAYIGLVGDRFALAGGPPRGRLKAALGVIVGIFSALTGTAGGVFAVPILKAYDMKLTHAIAIGSATGLVTGVVGTGAAMIEGWKAPGLPAHFVGFVGVPIVLAMIPTTVAGAWLGVRMGNYLSKVMLTRAYVAALFLLAADMAYGMAIHR